MKNTPFICCFYGIFLNNLGFYKLNIIKRVKKWVNKQWFLIESGTNVGERVTLQYQQNIF